MTGSIFELQLSELPDWITATDAGLDVDTDPAPSQPSLEGDDPLTSRRRR